MIKTTDIRELLARVTKWPWELAELPEGRGRLGLGGNDVARIGPYVYSRYLGAIAATPKDSGVFSNVGNNLRFVRAAPEGVDLLLRQLDARAAIIAWACRQPCEGQAGVSGKSIDVLHLMNAPKREFDTSAELITCGECAPCLARKLKE